MKEGKRKREGEEGREMKIEFPTSSIVL